jgi:hypothetical protein
MKNVPLAIFFVACALLLGVKSTSASYSFTATSNRTLVANFM